MYNKCTVQGTSALKNYKEEVFLTRINYTPIYQIYNNSNQVLKNKNLILSALKGYPVCKNKKDSIKLSVFFTLSVVILFAAVILI